MRPRPKSLLPRIARSQPAELKKPDPERSGFFLEGNVHTIGAGWEASDTPWVL